MTLTLLNLYNSTATQEWSMYDNDAADKSEFESSLILAINKAAAEILYSYPYYYSSERGFLQTPKRNYYAG